MRPNKPVLNATKLLISIGGFAANPGVMAGIKTGVSVAETWTKMWARPPASLDRLAEEMAAKAETLIASRPALGPDAGLLLFQMVQLSLPSPDEIMAERLQADALSRAMYAKLTLPEFRTETMRLLFRDVTVPILSRMFDSPDLVKDLTPAFMEKVLDDLGKVTALAERLEARVSETAGTQDLQTEMIVALAERYAEANPESFFDAYRELERALKLAAEEKRKGRLPGPVPEAVESILARADALNEAGHIDEASAELARLDAAYEAEIARLRDTRLQLIEKRITQAIMVRDPQAASEMVIAYLALREGARAPSYGSLWIMQNQWLADGKAQGLRFDMEVALDLARAGGGLARTEEETGAALNDLGVTLLQLGQVEADNRHLEEAVEVMEQALTIRSREAGEDTWLVTMNNFGAILKELGSREAGTARLDQALAVYETILAVVQPEMDPDTWANAQMNKGNVHFVLADRVDRTDPEALQAHLEQAVRHYDAAMQVWTAEVNPRGWLMAMINLANGRARLYEVTGRIEHLQAALRTYMEAQNRLHPVEDRVMLGTIQNNSGNLLRALGLRIGDPEQLEAARAQFNDALTVRTRREAPWDWAVTQANLARTEVGLGQIAQPQDKAAYYQAALTHAEAALDVHAGDPGSRSHAEAAALRDEILDLIAQT